MPGTRYSTEEMLAHLIAFDTTSRDGNIPLIEWVEAYLDGWGVPHFRVDYEAGKKTNLFATIGPASRAASCSRATPMWCRSMASPGPRSPSGVPTARDGRLFGRGTCDMKGFLAVCLAMAPDFQKAKLSSPIHLALSCDEEVKGVRPRSPTCATICRSRAPSSSSASRPR